MVDARKQAEVIVVIPVFNDWDCLDVLLQRLDLVLQEHHILVELLVIDDGSTVPLPRHFPSDSLKAILQVDILHLRRNVGHQRAIAVGLAFVHANRPCEAILVMDADGEDRPSDVPVLLQRFHEEGGRKIVFAERTKRSESGVFKLFYALYRVLHRVLTGFGVRVGNFSVIPFTSLISLVVVSDLWNHYAAAVFKARLAYATVPTARGSRLSGYSTMNFIPLVVHGLSALSVYGDIIGVRLLVAGIALIALVCAGLFGALVIRFATNLAIPGWATYTSGILLMLLVQVVMMCLILIFTILNSRPNLTFIPMRDYQYFVKSVTRALPHAQ